MVSVVLLSLFVRVGGELVKTGRVFCAELTPRRSRRNCARECMEYLTDTSKQDEGSLVLGNKCRSQ